METIVEKINEAFNNLKSGELRYRYIWSRMNNKINRLYLKYKKINSCNSHKISKNECVDVYDIIYDHDIHNMIEDALKTLTERESRILQLYFFDELTLKQIGEYESICKDRVRQIVYRSLRKLRYPRHTRKLISYIHED